MIRFKDLCFDDDGSLMYVMQNKHKMMPKSILWKVLCGKRYYAIKDMEQFNYVLTDKSLKLIWEHPDIVVAVVVRYDDGYRWEIETEGTSKEIREVVFPVFNNISKPYSATGNDYLTLPYQGGWIVKDPLNTLLKHVDAPFYLGRSNGKYENEYPASFSFQFFTYYCNGFPGYYFAAEDQNSYIKTFSIYNENDNITFAMTNYPEDMGKVLSYNMPYDFVLDFHFGDWQTAANKYREWATKQRFCGKTLKEKGIHEIVEDVDLWHINHTNYDFGTRTDEYFNTNKKIKESLNCNLALHWYGWNMGEHDVNYPDFISDEKYAEGWSEELTEWNEKFTKEHILKIPYTNARLWDSSKQHWDKREAKTAALKNADMQLYYEPWKGDSLKPMCPSTELWKNTVMDFSKYVNENSFDGLYIDQVGSFNAALCFDTKHPHPIGGGNWWKKEYVGTINGLRNKSKKDIILTTESCCEAYIDIFDLFLVLDITVTPGEMLKFFDNYAAEPIPLFNMIYGKYALGYGSCARFTDSEDVFEFNLIRNVLWGQMPTIEGVDEKTLCTTNNKSHMSILKKTVDFYKKYKSVFLYGRLVEINDIKCDIIKLEWKQDNKSKYLEYPSIIEGVWEDDSGDKYCIAYNMSKKNQIITIKNKNITVQGKCFICERV